MAQVWFGVGALLGAAGVALGAFGAHGLRSRVAADLLVVFETGVRYHLIHALALLAVGWAATRWPGPWIQAADGCSWSGFSSSRQSLSSRAQRRALARRDHAARWRCLILGWLALALGSLRAS